MSLQILVVVASVASVIGALVVLGRELVRKRRLDAEFSRLCRSDRAAFRQLRHAQHAVRKPRRAAARGEVLCDRDLGRWQPEVRTS